MKISLIDQVLLPGVPSGSALEWAGERFFIFGDDSPFIHLFTRDWLPLETVELPRQDPAHYRIPKPIKHDIESAFAVQQAGEHILYALGSGSVRGNRDTVFIASYLELSDHIEVIVIDAVNWYDQCRKMLPEGNELNIEGSALVGDTLLLAQRGHMTQGNYLLACPFNGKDTFSKANTPFHLIPVDMPELLAGGGLSGLTYDRAANRLWYCGSIEATSSTYDDGEIQGSFIGSWSLDTVLKNDRLHCIDCARLDVRAGHGIAKIESLSILESDGNNYRIAAIADDDIGGTEAFILEVGI